MTDQIFPKSELDYLDACPPDEARTITLSTVSRTRDRRPLSVMNNSGAGGVVANHVVSNTAPADATDNPSGPLPAPSA